MRETQWYLQLSYTNWGPEVAQFIVWQLVCGNLLININSSWWGPLKHFLYLYLSWGSVDITWCIFWNKFASNQLLFTLSWGILDKDSQLTFQSVPRLTPSSRQWELSHVFAMLSGSFPRFERLPAGVLRHTCSFTCSCSSGSFLSVKGSVHLNYENHYFLSYFYWCLEHFAQSWQLSCDYFLSACVGCLFY